MQEEAEDVGIRPIYGIEFYMCDDMEKKGLTDEEKDEATKGVPHGQKREAIYAAEVRSGVRERFHLTVLAKNEIGLRNLYRLSSLGWIKGFWKRPRIDKKSLLEHHEGLVVLSGCTTGAIATELRAGDFKAAVGAATELLDVFGSDFYAEIMPHDMIEQVEVNKGVIKIADAYGIPIVATQDAHYVEPDDWKYQEAMLCIHGHDMMLNPYRFKFSTHDFWLKDRAAIEESFAKFHGYLNEDEVRRYCDATAEVADLCQAKIEVDRFKAIIPSVPLPSEFGGDEFAYMKHLCMEGWRDRGIDDLIRRRARIEGVDEAEMRRVYLKRFHYEMEAVMKQKCVRYFLVVWDIYKWVRRQGIMVGPGRGSVGGSLVAFLLYITDIDPIEHKLLFERFLSPARIDMPDVDMDFEDARREEIIQYLRDTYGNDRVAQIAANGHLTGKACLRDIGRIMGIPQSEINPVVSSIVLRSSGDERVSQTIEDAFKEFPVCVKFNERYPQVLEFARKLEGQAKSLGKHAAGVVITPEPLIDTVPLELRQDSVVTAIDMFGVANLGLMKLDILGIRNLTMMKHCLIAVKERHGVDIDLNEIPLDDQPTLDGFTAHNYIGIFQYDTTSADKISEGVTFDCFDDVAAMIALDRPGTARSGLATEYLKRKKDPKARVSIHPVVDEICKDTLGVIVYQEHVMRIFTDVAGFSPATADSLRRKIAKKFGDEAIAKEQKHFVEGAVARGFTRELAEKLINAIKFFGSYGFNRAHSVAYGLTSYRQMYLKVHYTLEFMWASLATESNRDEIMRLVKEARRLGLNVVAPDINTARATWSIDEDKIIGALSDIKGVGPSAVKAIEAARPFKNFIDFCERIDRRKVHSGVMDILIKAGAFDNLVPNPKWLSDNLKEVWGWVNVKKDWKSKMLQALLDSAKLPDWTEEERDKLISEINPVAFGKDPLEPYAKMFEALGVQTVSMGSEDLFDNVHGIVFGQVIEVRYNQVGDFHSGAEPTEQEKAKMGWGKRYANLNVEDQSSKQNRVKIDTDIFEINRAIVDKGNGTIIAAHVSFNKRFKSIKAHFVVELEPMLRRFESGEPFTLFERALIPKEHPVQRDINKTLSAIKSGQMVALSAMVTHIGVRIDKRGGEMAWIGLSGASGYAEAVCFASAWPAFKSRIEAGFVGKFILKKDKTSLILDDVPNAVVSLTT